MGWVRSAVAAVAIFGVGAGAVAPAFAQQATADELERLLGEQRTDGALSGFAPMPEETLLGEEELDELLAPVALYPDALLAQVLVAATYPLQVVKADRLLAETEGLSDERTRRAHRRAGMGPERPRAPLRLPDGHRAHGGRPRLDRAPRRRHAAQDDDVLAAVQRLRAEALDTGYLASNDAQVVEETPDEITIRPADPEVVYVPSYDPALAYTTAPTAAPYIAPSNNPLANPSVAGAIAFGAALLVQELFADDDDDDDGWDDYWGRSRPIDWRDRQFYPRPHGRRHHDELAWSQERDAYWDPSRRIWRYDADAREGRARERHEAVAWTRRPHDGGRERARTIRAAAAAPAPALLAAPNPRAPEAMPAPRRNADDAPKRREARKPERRAEASRSGSRPRGEQAGRLERAREAGDRRAGAGSCEAEDGPRPGCAGKAEGRASARTEADGHGRPGAEAQGRSRPPGAGGAEGCFPQAARRGRQGRR